MNSVATILRVAEKAGYWEKLFPECSITHTPFSDALPDYEVSPAQQDRIARDAHQEGYFCLEPVLPAKEVWTIANAIRAIVGVGLPPVFCFVYDEVWRIFSRLNQVLEPILEPGFRFKTAGMWGWYIDNRSAGFPPHRDLLGLNIEPDGRPSNLSIWIPFTDATLHNGCIYVVPTNMDPDFPHNLKGGSTIDVQCVRAVPARAGSVLGWSSNIIHWGARSSHFATEPRISIGVGYNRADYYGRAGRPKRDDNLGAEFIFARGTAIPFGDRLSYIGQAIWTYKQRVAALFPDTAAALFDFCREHCVSPDVPAAVDAEATSILIRERKRIVHKLQQAGKHIEAQSVLRQLCEDYPGDADAWQLRGWQEGFMNQLDVAETCFRQAIALQDNLPEARKGLTKVLQLKLSLLHDR
jgi:hypothetical protein